jgi:hypothetical protein
VGQRGPLSMLLGRLGDAPFILAAVSGLMALVLAGSEIRDPGAVGGPIGWVLAVLLLLNAAVRLWFGRWRARARR